MKIVYGLCRNYYTTECITLRQTFSLRIMMIIITIMIRYYYIFYLYMIKRLKSVVHDDFSMTYVEYFISLCALLSCKIVFSASIIMS